MTCNLHQILHLVETVEKFGPLFTISWFSFENLNGILKNFVMGSNSPELQISSSFTTFHYMLHLKNTYLTPNSEVLEFCNNVIFRSKRRRKVQFIEENLFIIGVSKKNNFLDDNIKKKIKTQLKIDSQMFSFCRLLKNGLYYETENYSGNKKRNSSTVVYVVGDREVIGIINSFIQVKNENQIDKLYAIIERCVYLKAFYCSFLKKSLFSILLCNKMKNVSLDVIEVKNLKNVCVNIMLNDLMFVVKPLNTVEME